MKQENCILCSTTGGELIAQTPQFRVIRATDQPLFPLTYRLIWQAHVQEFSDLNKDQRYLCCDAMAWLEAAMRRFLKPDKMNLATLGNVVPHLHWHVIARYEWDSTFPAPVWGAVARHVDSAQWQHLTQQKAELEAYIRENSHQIA